MDTAELIGTTRFFVESFRHVHRLRRQQRHSAALDTLFGLRRLRTTIIETQADHGFFAEVFFRDVFDELDYLLADH